MSDKLYICDGGWTQHKWEGGDICKRCGEVRAPSSHAQAPAATPQPDTRERRLVCQGKWKAHRFDGTMRCFRCGVSRLDAHRESVRLSDWKTRGKEGLPPPPGVPSVAPPALPPVPCVQGILRHRFDGQPNCIRCGISKAEHEHTIATWNNSRRVNVGGRVTLARGPSAEERNDPYAGGYEAFANDLRNPFKESDKRRDQWFEGWHRAAEDAARRDLEAA